MGDISAVWALVPDVGCKGLCAEACGPIAASPVELAILARRGVMLPDLDETLTAVLSGRPVDDCPALVAGRCSVYDVRPTICRLWGAVEAMSCPHGCRPLGGLIPDGVAGVLLAQADAATSG